MMRIGWLATIPALMTAGPAFAGGTIVLDTPGMRAGPDLSVTSSAFAPGSPIPAPYSDYDKSVSFPLAWSAGPPGTKTYTVMIQDPDAAPATPILHWLTWDIPATTTSLPEATGQSTVPEARTGVNTHGKIGYFGPHPPAGDLPHHYHVEVFALDTTLDVVPGETVDAVAKAMKGHVLAQGELVGTFAKAK